MRTPTLIVHRSGDVLPVEGARYMGRTIPGARFVELAGQDHAFFVDSEQILEPEREFLADVRTDAAVDEADPARILATVLFTDIVDSTAKAVELGDQAWRQLLADHHARVRRQLGRFRGTEIDTAGDGVFATFDGPARAIRSAFAIRESLGELGLQVRAGLHTGECELMGDKIGGIAVHIGARVVSLAQPDEVLVSSTVKDLVAGSGITFADRGAVTLKGIPDQWRLYAVTDVR